MIVSLRIGTGPWTGKIVYYFNALCVHGFQDILGIQVARINKQGGKVQGTCECMGDEVPVDRSAWRSLFKGLETGRDPLIQRSCPVPDQEA